MPVERKQSFDEIMAALDVPVDLIPGKNRTANPPSPPFLPDSINLSTQGEKALPVRKDIQKRERREEPDPIKLDNQGNRIRISVRGSILAESHADAVAWETKLK